MKLDTFRRLDDHQRRIRQLERTEPESGGGGGPVAWADITGKPDVFPPTVYEASFASPATSWVIAHGLGSNVVEVNCYDPTGTTEYDPEIEITDAYTAVVRWYYPTTGIARVIG